MTANGEWETEDRRLGTGDRRPPSFVVQTFRLHSRELRRDKSCLHKPISFSTPTDKNVCRTEIRPLPHRESYGSGSCFDTPSFRLWRTGKLMLRQAQHDMHRHLSLITNYYFAVSVQTPSQFLPGEFFFKCSQRLI